MARKYDVVVVGGGPSGAAAARRLVASGLQTLVIEKKTLPREKMCSGILTPLTVNFVARHFGVIPESVYAHPEFIRGMAMHFPSLKSPLAVNAQNAIPNVWRSHFDHFLLQRSGAQVQEATICDSLEQDHDGYVLNCRVFDAPGKSKPLRLNARYVVAADGSNSRVVRSLTPHAYRGYPTVLGLQFHYQAQVDLDPAYFHVFFWPEVGIYAWASIKDDDLHIGSATLKTFRTHKYLARLIAMLKSHYGLKIKKELHKEGMSGPVLAPFGRFVLGQDKVLSVGDAAGFMHTGGEGISCSLASGDLAAQAIVEAGQSGRRPLPIYQEIARGEMEYCLDQFNPLRMMKSVPMPLDFWTSLKSLSPGEIGGMIRDFRGLFGKPDNFGGINVGRPILHSMYYRLVHGRYPLLLD